MMVADSGDHVVGLALAVAAVVYLIVVLVFPERF